MAEPDSTVTRAPLCETPTMTARPNGYDLPHNQTKMAHPIRDTTIRAELDNYGLPYAPGSFDNQVTDRYYNIPQPVGQPPREPGPAHPLRHEHFAVYDRQAPTMETIKDNTGSLKRGPPDQQPAYFRLPGEIRHHIMRLVLGPGQVYPPAYRSPETRKPEEPVELVKEATKAEHQISGISLLRVSQQVHIEACTLFFSENTFYLPPGPVDEATVYFSFLCHAHKAQIRKMAIRLSIADLTASAISQFQIGAFPRFGAPPRAPALVSEMDKCLWWMWASKLKWIANFHAAQIAAGEQGLETVTVESKFAATVVLSGDELMLSLAEPHIQDLRTWRLPKTAYQVGLQSSRGARVVLNNQVQQHGWPVTREFLRRARGWWEQQ